MSAMYIRQAFLSSDFDAAMDLVRCWSAARGQEKTDEFTVLADKVHITTQNTCTANRTLVILLRHISVPTSERHVVWVALITDEAQMLISKDGATSNPCVEV